MGGSGADGPTRRTSSGGSGDFRALSALAPEPREALLSVARRRRVQRHDTVVLADDPGDGMFLIESGHVAVRIVTEYGDETTLAVLGPGDSFGELALLTEGYRRSATVVALEQSVLLTVSRTQLLETLGGRGAVEALVVHVLSQQVHRLSAQLVEARFVPVRHRVTRALIALCGQYAPISGRTSLHVTQDDIAGLAGATRPTVNQVLRALQDAGAVELHRGRVDVVDRAVLERHRG